MKRIGRRYIRSLLVVGLAAALALASAVVFAGHESSVSYTGCLNVNGGTIVSVAAGNAPQAPCGPNQIQLHLGGGDITAVTAGTGLQGGTTSGSATLAVQPSYRLPQGCSAGGVAKWTGSLWECAADADTDTFAYAASDFNGESGMPDSPAPVRSFVLPAGKYAIFAKVNVSFGEFDSDAKNADCRLVAESDFDVASIVDVEGGSLSTHALSLMLVHEFTGEGLVEFVCRDSGHEEYSDFNDASWWALRIVAIKLGSFEDIALIQ